MNRRKFLATLGVTATGLMSSRPLLSANTSVATRTTGSQRPKNLIVLVSDGMSHGTLALADQYHQWKGQGPCHWIRLLQEGKGRRAMMDMASLNSLVTDSAAAASSWGGGARVNNGSLNVAADQKWHTPLWVKAKAAGKATGLVTTAPSTHATPAGFAVNVAARGNQDLIAEQYLERGMDVVMGGGREGFLAERRKDKRDMLAEYKAGGYDVVLNRDELLQSTESNGRLLGLFIEDWMPYEVDRVNDEKVAARIPTLLEMMQAALRRLRHNEDGFVLLVEGGKVDYAAHQNDFAGLIYDQLAFDACIHEAETFCNESEDTLVVVCTDHGNANPGISEGGNRGAAAFRFLDASKGSYLRLLSGIGGKSTLENWQERIHQYTGVTLSSRDSGILQQYIDKQHVPASTRQVSQVNFLGQLLSNYTQVGWVGNNHTSDYVELMAVGAGSEQLPSFIRNDRLHHYLVEQLQLASALAG